MRAMICPYCRNIVSIFAVAERLICPSCDNVFRITSPEAPEPLSNRRYFLRLPLLSIAHNRVVAAGVFSFLAWLALAEMMSLPPRPLPARFIAVQEECDDELTAHKTAQRFLRDVAAQNAMRAISFLPLEHQHVWREKQTAGGTLWCVEGIVEVIDKHDTLAFPYRVVLQPSGPSGRRAFAPVEARIDGQSMYP
jgi:hypothetical protein